MIDLKEFWDIGCCEVHGGFHLCDPSMMAVMACHESGETYRSFDGVDHLYELVWKGESDDC